MTDPVILWHRQDLRLADQPAVIAAAADGPIIPVYVFDDDTPSARHRIGGAQRWWLHGSLEKLGAAYEGIGSRLILRRGRSDEVLASIAEDVGAKRIHGLHHSEPWWRDAEARLEGSIEIHDGDALAPAGSIRNGSGHGYRIYSAFWRALQLKIPPSKPLAAPKKLERPDSWPKSDCLDDWRLLPTKPDWATGFDMIPGEKEAHRRLENFTDHVEDYEAERNLPGEEGTSRLSPHLHFGEISPSQVWHGVDGHRHAEKFRKELAWRDFSKGVVEAMPNYADRAGSAKFDRLPWRTGADAKRDLAAWTRGITGYPIVDAGMRQLWATGWMHNRVRMIAASFLTKHLLIDWRDGWAWFWDTLLDADYGNNSVNWQWVAGTGVDANMFGRIMAPIVQSEKFDAGGYIRRWVPELAEIGDGQIHDPGPVNGYPQKIVDHRIGRERALEAGRSIRG